MNWLEALAFWRRFKPWLDKPWVKSILGFLVGLFKRLPDDPNKPKVYHDRDPDKPVAVEDIQRGDPA